MLLIGDVHSRWRDLMTTIDEFCAEGQDIIQVGDFGLGFVPPEQEREQLDALDRFLIGRHSSLWVIRGNHFSRHCDCVTLSQRGEPSK
jgi:metallophosphoesterase superfamily enzyme